MNRKKARYKKMEALITLALCLDVVIFLAFLVFAGIGMTGLKAVTAVLCFAISERSTTGFDDFGILYDDSHL